MLVSILTLSALLLAGPALPAPDDLEDSFQQLKQAEANKDAALVKKFAAETCALARKSAAEPAPTDATEKEAWEEHIKYVKQIETHTEYSLYSTAIQSKPATMVELLGALEQQNPKSQYLNEVYSTYFVALTQTGAAAKIPAVAEKALANFPNNEDLLLVLADSALARNQSARAHGYAERLVNVMSRHPKPEGVSAADWERKKTASLGRGYWISGVVHATDPKAPKFSDADKELRAALPYIKGNDSMRAAALFYLGVANYQLGRLTANRAQVMEAAKFSEQAAAIAGPLSSQAYHNAQVMRTDALKMR